MTVARVLVVDDDMTFIRRVTVSLGSLADIESLSSGEDLLGYVQVWRPDVIVLNLLLDDRDGFQLLEELLGLNLLPAPYVLCSTSGPAAKTRVCPCDTWPVGTISRGTQLQQIRETVQAVLESRSELLAAVS
jgi:CheY-like chemotaxis protein